MTLATRLKSLFKPSDVSRQRIWPTDPLSAPWFDKPDARDILEQRFAQGIYTESEYELLAHWIEHGYVILKRVISHDAVDEMNAEIDAVWEASEAIEGLRIEEVRIDDDRPPGISHEDLIKIPPEARLAMRASQRWRVHGFYRFSEKARAIYQNKEVKRLCSLLFDREAVPHYSINFMYGSRQELHQDTAVFHVHPANFLIGAWLACEDIAPDAGPLIYCPGSHRTPLYSEFGNYPQTNLRTCDRTTTYRYNEHVQATADKFEKVRFIANKGDVLLWHGMLIHGGDVIRDMGLTRKSHVTHYIAEGMDKSGEVRGPFNWG